MCWLSAAIYPLQDPSPGSPFLAFPVLLTPVRTNRHEHCDIIVTSGPVAQVAIAREGENREGSTVS